MRNTSPHHSFVLTALLLAGCGGGLSSSTSSSVQGRTSDELGAQRQGLGGDSFGGSGSANATTTVRVSRIAQDGTLQTVGEAKVSAGGEYEVELSALKEIKLIAQAIDASGKVRGSVIIEASGAQGETVVASPIDTESSVEAEVLQKMVSQGVTLSEANAIDLRARINAQMAEAVKASSDAAARIKALAEAVASAQRAQVEAHGAAGVPVSQAALFDLQLDAAAKLNEALDAAPDKAAKERAYEDFVAQVQAKTRERAGNAKTAAQGERAASIAFRATVKARLQASSAQALDPVADAAGRQAAALEARAATAAADAILKAGGAAQIHLDALKIAANTLHADLASASSIAGSAQAYSSFRASVVGSSSVSGSVVGRYLEVNSLTAASVQATVNASANAAAELDASLSAAVTASIKASEAIDFDALAKQIVSALKTFDSAVKAQSNNLAAFGGRADVALELIIHANGAMRMAE